MNELTYQEFLDAPVDIQYLWLAYIFDKQVGASFYIKTKEKYPEYFEND